MTWDIFIALAGFAFVTSITPGPNNLMLMASGANFGFRRTIPHMLGIGIGHMVMVFLLGAGLIRVFDTWPVTHDVLKTVSIAYLLWLAWKIATAAPVLRIAIVIMGRLAFGRMTSPSGRWRRSICLTAASAASVSADSSAKPGPIAPVWCAGAVVRASVCCRATPGLRSWMRPTPCTSACSATRPSGRRVGVGGGRVCSPDTPGAVVGPVMASCRPRAPRPERNSP